MRAVRFFIRAAVFALTMLSLFVLVSVFAPSARADAGEPIGSLPVPGGFELILFDSEHPLRPGLGYASFGRGWQWVGGAWRRVGGAIAVQLDSGEGNVFQIVDFRLTEKYRHRGIPLAPGDRVPANAR